MENNQSENKKLRMYRAVIIILLVIVVVLSWLLISTKSEVRTIIVEKEAAIDELQVELDQLMKEHESIKVEYATLSSQLSEKDSVIMAKAKEIEDLINSQADYRKIKKQLDYLRSITQGYVGQIDSLYRVNQMLVEENIEIKQNLQEEQKKTFDLSQNKEELEGKITSAAVLRAYNVTVKPLSMKGTGKETDTDKARRTDAIRVCFTIGENSLIPSGTKDIYLRIARPDNLILTQGSYSFIFRGERIQFSEKISVQYNQKSQNACITYKRGDIELMTGDYHINLFADDQMIGEGTFTLK